MANNGTIDKLDCPKCGFSKSKVVDSRPASFYIRRRRECGRCKARFNSFEVSGETMHRFKSVITNLEIINAALPDTLEIMRKFGVVDNE